MKKSVMLTLAPMSFVVEGKDDKELIENAKKAMVEALKTAFPHITYSISDADIMTEEQAKPGTIVKDDEGRIGIITSYKPSNKRPIAVTYSTGIRVDGFLSNFKVADVTFEEARHKRQDWAKPEWSEGDSAYFKNKGKIEEIVLGKKEGKKRLAFIVNGNGLCYKLTEEQIKALFKDEKSELI